MLLIRRIPIKSKYYYFYLESKYYNKSEIIEIDNEEFDKMIENKESFALFIHKSMCSTSYLFNKVVVNTSKENSMTFYKLNYEDMQKTFLSKEIDFYPSFALFDKGNLVSFLKADKNKDMNYYKSEQQLTTWLSKYINLKEKTNEQ